MYSSFINHLMIPVLGLSLSNSFVYSVSSHVYRHECVYIDWVLVLAEIESVETILVETKLTIVYDKTSSTCMS